MKVNIKKFCLFLILFLIILFSTSSIVFSKTGSGSFKYKDIKGTNLQIISRYKGKGLIEKGTNKVILPKTYDKIKKFKYKNKTYISAYKKYPLLISIYSVDGSFEDLVEKYYTLNNGFQDIKFKNYPKNGIIIYEKDENQGFIIVEDKILHIISPEYKVIVPDQNSIAARMLNISFAPDTSVFVNKKGIEQKLIINDSKIGFISIRAKQIIIPAVINENIKTENGKITVRYNNISFEENSLFIRDNEFYIHNKKSQKYKNIKAIEEPLQNYVLNISRLKKLYEHIKAKTSFDFCNYPEDAIMLMNKYIYVFEGNHNYKIENKYQDVFIFDKSSVINQITGLNISFQDINKIIVKKDNKWGVIDKNGLERIPFIYDAIYPCGSNIEEVIENITDLEAKQLIIKYKGKTKDENIFMCKKDNYYGVIDINNKIILPFNQLNYMQNDDLNKIIYQIEKKNQQEKSNNKIKKIWHRIYKISEKTLFYIMSIALIPIAIVCPPVGLVLLMGFECL